MWAGASVLVNRDMFTYPRLSDPDADKESIRAIQVGLIRTRYSKEAGRGPLPSAVGPARAAQAWTAIRLSTRGEVYPPSLPSRWRAFCRPSGGRSSICFPCAWQHSPSTSACSFHVRPSQHQPWLVSNSACAMAPPFHRPLTLIGPPLLVGHAAPQGGTPADITREWRRWIPMLRPPRWRSPGRPPP